MMIRVPNLTDDELRVVDQQVYRSVIQYTHRVAQFLQEDEYFDFIFRSKTRRCVPELRVKLRSKYTNIEYRMGVWTYILNGEMRATLLDGQSDFPRPRILLDNLNDVVFLRMLFGDEIKIA